MTEKPASSIVLIPFNAAASLKRQHKDAPTYGQSRNELWLQVVGLVKEQWADYNSQEGRTSSTYYHFYNRFSLDKWTPDRVEADRNHFLAHETKANLVMEGKMHSTYRNFLGLDLKTGKVIGESLLWQFNRCAHVAYGHDTLRKSLRGQHLSYPFLLAKCEKAKELGYLFYDASVDKNNGPSLRRLEHLMDEGRALPMQSYEKNTLRFHIDLAKI